MHSISRLLDGALALLRAEPAPDADGLALRLGLDLDRARVTRKGSGGFAIVDARLRDEGRRIDVLFSPGARPSLWLVAVDPPWRLDDLADARIAREGVRSDSPKGGYALTMTNGNVTLGATVDGAGGRIGALFCERIAPPIADEER